MSCAQITVTNTTANDSSCNMQRKEDDHPTAYEPDFSEEPWYKKQLKDTKDVNQNDLNVDVVLLVVNEIEFDAALKALSPLSENENCVWHVLREINHYYIGKFGSFVTALAQCDMASGTSLGAHAIASAAIRHWNPRAVINVGVAWGRREKKQKLGDVLVATQVVGYAINDCISETICTELPPCSSVLYSHFMTAANKVQWPTKTSIKPKQSWPGFENNEEPRFRVYLGRMLSGGILLDNSQTKSELLQHADYEMCIVGEMEG